MSNLADSEYYKITIYIMYTSHLIVLSIIFLIIHLFEAFVMSRLVLQESLIRVACNISYLLAIINCRTFRLTKVASWFHIVLSLHPILAVSPWLSSVIIRLAQYKGSFLSGTLFFSSYGKSPFWNCTVINRKVICCAIRVIF